MIALGIDTSGRGGAVALATVDRVLGRQVHDPALGFAEELFGLFDQLLADSRTTRAQIDIIAVLTGPGSFTGLRIGVMTAKALAFALDRPLCSAPTLDLLAAAAGAGRQVAAIDAGGGHAWVREFGVSVAGVDPRGPLRRIASGDLSDETDLVSAAPLVTGRVIDDLAGPLARLAAAGAAPVVPADPASLIPDYGALSQAERVHGLDLTEELGRPIEPRGWES